MSMVFQASEPFVLIQETDTPRTMTHMPLLTTNITMLWSKERHIAQDQVSYRAGSDTVQRCFLEKNIRSLPNVMLAIITQ